MVRRIDRRVEYVKDANNIRKNRPSTVVVVASSSGRGDKGVHIDTTNTHAHTQSGKSTYPTWSDDK